MKQEDKELLLKDICGRLPYGIITKNCRNNFDVPAHLLPDVIGIKLLIDEYDLKPYLRPMSSMTKEELEEYDSFFNTDYGYMDAGLVFDVADWVNSHHFDYRGLIEKGLAIEAPKDMYKTK